MPNKVIVKMRSNDKKKKKKSKKEKKKTEELYSLGRKHSQTRPRGLIIAQTNATGRIRHRLCCME